MKYKCDNHIMDENGEKFFIRDNVNIESDKGCFTGEITLITGKGIYLGDKYARADLITAIKLNSRKRKGIPVSEKYIIDTLDPLNVTVKEKYTPKPKTKENGEMEYFEPQWKAISYHPNVELAYKSIVNEELNVSCGSTTELVEKIKELKEFKKKINL
ncbi:hypothetical protein CLPUN_03090 [Clostridium puniceum]|uniref:Uncharacterized protein n=1 Tax=Clostridium puniceum TaxID=29367 RepID=A0A1S8TX25_9CLOT|nr:hypothetical protein [Clostridium puniceum]OOM82308.1 hypothetical protein CLPUN_03090 [Clostridium puniceum]